MTKGVFKDICVRGNIRIRGKYNECLCPDCKEYRRQSEKKRRLSGDRQLWEKNNREKLNKSQHKWNIKNKDKVKNSQKKYRDSEKGKIKTIDFYKKYTLSAKGVYTHLKNVGRHPVLISKEDFIKWYVSQEQKCGYCEITIEKIKEFPLFFNGTKNKRMSVDRIDNNKGYEDGNLILSCRRCNSIKSDFFSLEEMKEISRLFVKPKWDK